MGEAKRRGSFEERKTIAVEKRKAQAIVDAEIQRRKPSPKLSGKSKLTLAVYSVMASSVSYRGK